MSVIPDPKASSLFKEQAAKTHADIAVIIGSSLQINDDTDQLYLITVVDIETMDATGKSYNHYESSEFITGVYVDDEQLRLLTSPGPGAEEGDVRAGRLFSDGGVHFKPLFDKLLLQTQQKLYYFFTGNDTPPPVATTHAGP